MVFGVYLVNTTSLPTVLTAFRTPRGSLSLGGIDNYPNRTIIDLLIRGYKISKKEAYL